MKVRILYVHIFLNNRYLRITQRTNVLLHDFVVHILQDFE